MEAFISYSRKDEEFVKKLQNALSSQDNEVWVDFEGIPLTTEWRQEIYEGIEKSDNFIFIISPDSIISMVCHEEIEHAVRNNKRLVPILYRETDPDAVHPEVARINWIYFWNHEFENNVKSLVQALNTDIQYVKIHTRLLTRAIEWNRRKNNHSYLLRSSDLKEAEQWLLQETADGPFPTSLQKTYLSQSRQAETTRLQRIITSVSVALIVILVLSVLAFVAWQSSERQLIASTAKSAHLLSEANQGFEALIESQRAAHRLQKLTWVAKDAKIKNQVLLALQEAVYGVREFNRLEGHQGVVHSVGFRPDGQVYVSAGDDRTIKLWDQNGVPLRTLKGHRDTVFDARFSPDGQMMASASGDHTIKLWQQDGRLYRTLKAHTGAVYRVGFSPDGQTMASASADKTIKLWRRDGSLLKTMFGHRDEVNDVCFSPDGRMIASASVDKTIIIWSREGKLVKTIAGYNLPVLSVSFSPDSELLAATSLDGTVVVRNLDGELVFKRLEGGVVHRIVFSPDGHRLASASFDNTVILWNLDDLYNLDRLRAKGCDWLHSYLANNPNVAKQDKHLCDGIPASNIQRYQLP